MSVVVPVRNLRRRLDEIGRIRIGVKNDAGEPLALKTFRFTSADENAITEVARLYGARSGPRPWNDGMSQTPQWEVITDASEIDVVLPADPLGDGPVYELRDDEGRLDRRCDGEKCDTYRRGGPHGTELIEVPCMCEQEGELSCLLTIRLNVVLPGLNCRLGTWRIDSKSTMFAKEALGLVELVHSLQSRGMTRARLGIQHKDVPESQRTYTFPALHADASFDELASGAARVSHTVERPVGADAAAARPGEETGQRSTQGTTGMPRMGDAAWQKPDDAALAAFQSHLQRLSVTSAQASAFLSAFYGVDAAEKMSGPWLVTLVSRIGDHGREFTEAARKAAEHVPF